LEGEGCRGKKKVSACLKPAKKRSGLAEGRPLRPERKRGGSVKKKKTKKKKKKKGGKPSGSEKKAWRRVRERQQVSPVA